ncbi:MAG: hypothetical protein ACI84C_002303 [Flavobacteriales bacterium]
MPSFLLICTLEKVKLYASSFELKKNPSTECRVDQQW